MPTYTLTQARNQHGEVFDQALAEPVILTKKGRPSHVVVSAQAFANLTNRLAELEDQLVAQKAAEAMEYQQMVGSKEFTSALQRMIDDQH